MLHRLSGPLCFTIVKQNLKQRPGTIKRCTDVCLALVELEQSEPVLVRECLHMQSSKMELLPAGHHIELSP